MKRIVPILIVFSLTLSVWPQELKVATFEVDATPPIGSPLAYDPVKDFDVPLSCRGVVISGTDKPIVICAVDWIGIGSGGQTQFKRGLAEAAGTTPDRVAVHTLHQHDAPRCNFTADKMLEPYGISGAAFNPEHARKVIRDAAAAIRSALKEAPTATHYGLGRGIVEKVASNRRILGPDGMVQYIRYTATRSPKIRAFPAGTIDPELKMITFWNHERCLAAITWYATHTQSYYRTGLPTPDFPGLARNDRQIKTGVPHIHFNGAGGNVGAGKWNDGSKKNRKILTDRIAAGMTKAWENTEKHPLSAEDIDWGVVPVVLPRSEHMDRNKLHATLADPKEKKSARFFAAKNLDWIERCRRGEPIGISCLTVGSARVLHLPGELFVEYQLNAQKLRPDLFVAMAAYGDYSPGYIGTEIAYSQGGYETSPGASKTSPKVEGVLMGAVKKLLHVRHVSEGPALGHLTSTSAMIWARCSHPGTYRLIARNETGLKAVAEVESSDEQDGCVVWKLNSLRPRTRYDYTIEHAGNQLVRGEDYSFTTLPAKGLDTVRIGFASCANEDEGSAKVWRQMHATDPHAVVLLGDTPYIDSTTLSFQRRRYAEFAGADGFKELVRNRPLYATWDDHDVGHNDTDGNLKHKENARRAFTEYRAQPSYGDGEAGIYTKFRRGGVEVFLLDARYFAGTEPSPFDKDKLTLLGSKQWEWLLRELKASTAQFKILASGMVWNGAVRPGKKDHWGTYPHERGALFEFIGKEKISGVILVGGDIHRTRILRHQTTDQAGYDIPELITSPVHASVIANMNVPHPALVHDSGKPNTFLLMTADTKNKTTTLHAKFVNKDGKTFYETEYTQHELSPPINKRIAITDAAFLNHNLPEAIAKMNQLGFQSIAIHHGGAQRTKFPTLGFDKADAAQRAKTIELMKSMKHVSIHETSGEEDFRPSIDAAAAVGAKVVTMHEKPGAPLAEQVSRFRAAGDYAAEHGVRIGAENLRGPYADYIKLVKAIKHPAVGCTIDTGHIAYLNEVKSIEDPKKRYAAYNDYLEKMLRAVKGKLIHMHVHNVRPGRGFIDHYADIKGPLDTPRLFRVLKELNYRGMVVIEVHRDTETLEQKATYGRYISELMDARPVVLKGDENRPQDESPLVAVLERMKNGGGEVILDGGDWIIRRQLRLPSNLILRATNNAVLRLPSPRLVTQAATIGARQIKVNKPTEFRAGGELAILPPGESKERITIVRLASVDERTLHLTEPLKSAIPVGSRLGYSHRMFLGYAVTNVSLVNLTIDGGRNEDISMPGHHLRSAIWISAPYNYDQGPTGPPAANISVSNCTITNCYGRAVAFYHTVDSQVTGCRIGGLKDEGIDFDHFASVAGPPTTRLMAQRSAWN
ncbi:MAG: alkaline phosphatase D family protein [Limisphaerales bacterium]